MAFKYREEIVGKRFLSVRSATKLKTSKLSDWDWRSGVIRAVTHKDTSNAEFTVLVEFDDCEWKRREWIRVHEIFQVFLVEFTLVWAPRPHPRDGSGPAVTVLWPALSYQVVVDKSGFAALKLRATEFVADRELKFLPDSELRFYKVGKFEADDRSVESPARDDPAVRSAVRRWLELQDGQSILLTTPSVLVGYRVEVYCAEGTRQWYTAVIHSYNENTRELSVTDDTVLEVHNEDPSMVQMKLIGDGVVESILKGENLGITPRRRSCNIRKVQPDAESTSSTSSSSSVQARVPRTRSQSPSQSSPLSAPAPASRTTPTRAKAARTRTAATTTTPATTTTGSNHSPAANTPAGTGTAAAAAAAPTSANPPDTAPIKDEKEKPPDRGKTRTSQRERKRRTDDVTSVPPAKLKASEKDKDDKEKKVCKEPALTRTTSVKAGSVLPASTQPTVVVKPVRTPADTKIIRDKDSPREAARSPKTTAATSRARKAKEVPKEPSRTGSPASGVRSRTPQRKEKEAKEKPSIEKPPVEPKRRTRDSSAKRKETKRESKRLKEDDSESSNLSKPPSPASSTSSVCSSIVSLRDCRSRTSTPTRLAETKASRASPAPSSGKGSSSDLGKKKDSSSSRAATPNLSDRVGPGGGSGPSAPQSSPAVEDSAAAPTAAPSSSSGSCSASSSSSSKEGSNNNNSSSRKPTATTTTTTTTTTSSCSSSSATVTSDISASSTSSRTSLSTTTTSSSHPVTASSSLPSSTPRSPCSTTGVTTTTTTTTTTALSCTTSTTSSSASCTSTATTTTTTTPTASRTSPNASPHPASSNSPTDSGLSTSRAPQPARPPGLGTGVGGRTSPPRKDKPDTGSSSCSSNNNKGSSSDIVVVRGGGKDRNGSSSTPVQPSPAATANTSTTNNTTSTSSRLLSSSPTVASLVGKSRTTEQQQKPQQTSHTSSNTTTSSSVPPLSPSPSVRPAPSSMSHTSKSHSSSSSSSCSKLLSSSGRTSSSNPASSSCSPSSSLLSSSAKSSSRPDDEPAMHYKKMILLEGFKKEPCTSSPPSATAAASQETFTAASGINVNHSLTDQIAKLSSLSKPWNNNDFSSPPPDGGAPPPGAHHPGHIAGGDRGEGGREYHHHHHQGGRPLVGHPLTSPTSSTKDRHSRPPSREAETRQLSRTSSSGSLGSHSRVGDMALMGRDGDPRDRDRDRDINRDRGSLSRSDVERHDAEVRERLAFHADDQQRSLSRSSAEERRPSSSSSASNSRVEDLRRSVGSTSSGGGGGETAAHGASPLIFDKNEPVRVYRDPELMKRDEMRYFQQRQQQQERSASRGGPNTPGGGAFAAVPPGHPAATGLGSPHGAALPQAPGGQRGPMLTHSLPYSPHLNSLQGLSPAHLSSLSPHHGLDPAALRVLSALPPQAMHPYPLLPQYALHSTTQLEILWQQKYPTLPVPPAWMLVQYQEELLRDVNLMSLERERRDREHALERERERVEQAERERAAERDRAEREQRERQRQERERLEREQREREIRERKHREEVAEREKAERLERERLEKERKEQERIKREQRERVGDRGHTLLKETAQAQAAVDQHFTESLRLASQKHAAGAVPWPTGAPSITHGLPKHPAPMAVPPEALSLTAHHQSAFTHRGIPPPHQVAPREHLPSKKDDKLSEGRPDQPSPHHHEAALRSQQEALRHSEEKRHQTLQQEHLLRHQIMMKEKAAGLPPDHHPHSAAKYPPPHHPPQPPHHPADIKKQYPMYVYHPKSVAPSSASQSVTSSATSAGMVMSASHTAVTSIKQEPNFSLYGYQPFQHSYITKETLYSQGLKQDDGGSSKGAGGVPPHPHHPHLLHLKEEPKGSLPPPSHPQAASMHPQQRTASPHGHKHGRVSPPPLIKDSKTGSVIVENRPKEAGDLRHQQQPSEAHRSAASHHSLPPPPAHSHHSGSITLGTALSPRQQQGKGPDGRPQAGGAAYGGHQSRPGSSPHPGHMAPHIHGLPTGSHHPGMVPPPGGRDHHSRSPLSAAQHQQGGMQPMDLHKHMPSSASTSMSTAVKEAPPRPTVVGSHPHHHGHGQAYPAAIAQPPVSLPTPSSTAAHSYNLIQQGLVPNPIYSHAGSSGQQPGPQGQQAVAGPHPQHPQHPSPHQHSPSSMAGQKRRGAPTKDTVEGSQSALPTHHKKSRMAEAMAASANPHAPHTAAGSNSSHSGSLAGHQPGAGLPPTSSSSSSPLARTTAPASQSTSSGFMDSFRSFVENTVQSAFYQDQELAAAKALQQRSNRPKAGAGPSSSNQAVHVLSTQASPMPSTVSVSSPQVASRLQATTTSLSGVPPTNHSSPFTSTTPPLSTQTQAHTANSSAASSLPTHQHTPLPSSSAMAISSLPQQHSIGGIPMQRPGPASTPGGASVSSTSSIVDTINRVANGYVESDSDTLSAPSPPPQRSDITPSPSCRPGNHKAFKKAWLQRYSDEDKEKENTTKEAAPSGAGVTGSTTTTPSTPPQPQENAEGKPGEPVKDCYVNCSYISPTKEGGSKSPISLLSKDLRKDEEDSTTSASETESQTSDGTAKRRLKAAARRRSSGSSGSKKPKLSDDDNSKPTGTTTNTTTTTTTTSPATTTTTTQTSTGGKKRFSRKGREGVKDSTNKGLSDDEAVKERMDNEEKSRQVLHNQHHKQHQTSTSPSARLVKAETKAEKTNTKNTDKTNDKTESTNSVTTNSKGKKGETSDSESTSTPKENNKKRGRKPRDKKDKDRDSTPPRTENLSTILANKPLNKTNMGKLKKTLEPFIQDSACPEIAPKLMKCRECKMSTNQRNKKIPNIFCRFYAFRRLRYNQKAVLAIAGFSEPSDADMDDIELWMPRLPVANPQLDVGKAKYVIQHVGDQFCQLVEQEKEAMSWVSPDTKVAWKRAVQGVREMCDVCDTTLFNMHWACHKCGFVVCIDCYRQRTRKTGGCMDNKCKTCDNDGQKWLTCSVNRQSHEPDKLMITQIIPSDALWVVGRMIHEVRDKWKIRANCPCGRSKDLLLSPKNGVSQLLSAAIKDSPDRDQDHRGPVLNGNSPTNGDDHKLYKNQTTSVNGNSPPGSLSPLSLLANVASMDSENSRDKKILSKMKEAFELSGGHYNPLEDVARGDDDEKSPANCSTLRELLTKTAGRMKPNPENNKKAKTTLDDIIQQVVERNLPKDSDVAMTPLLKHYIPKNGSTLLSGRDSPIRCYTLTETSVLYPDVPHSWLDNGRLLRLHDPRHKGNLKLFQQQWRRAQPVLVSNCHKRMTRNLWMPDTFAREFGDIENELVNCRTGISLVGHTMREFWEGFECAKKRLKDEKGRKMILKLKDWPPTEDFSEVLPGRFQDLMNGLPLPEYTHRNGIYNMASRLPDFFVKPDLGPKMYNAYGSALYPREGTTNLHLDVSDAVNTMVCVAIPRDDDVDHATAALKAIDEAGCDILTKQRIKETEEFPGALWHIFDPLDADKIRDLLNKIAKERGEKIEPHHDPIHDQSWYLDENIRKRLLEEYSVQGYTILQCLGDAVFIPAGAPHQVRNLHSCIKAAEDFVSPENVSYCFKMTQEFRHLSDTHSNHEDKLQVKNIIYHTVKDAVAVLREASP